MNRYFIINRILYNIILKGVFILIFLRIAIIFIGVLMIFRGLNPALFTKNQERIEKEKKWGFLYVILGITFITIQLIIIALRSSN